MTLSYTPVGQVTVRQPSNCVVTFTWSGSPSCNSTMDSKLETAFTGVDPGSYVEQTMESDLSNIFSSLTSIPGIDTFALQNLLFYPNQSLNLPGGSIPCDLLLVGSTVAELVLSPASPVTVAIGPGSPPPPIQFSATLQGQAASNLVWEMSPSVPSHGSLDSSTGLYTSPSTVPPGAAVKITASNGTQSGYGLVLLVPGPAPGSLTVTPPQLTLTPGQAFDLGVTDASGQAVDVSWSLSPPSPAGGTLALVFGSWQYTAPSVVTSPSSVTLTATSTSDSSQTGTAVVSLLPSGSLSVVSSASSVAPGGQLTVTPSVPDGVSSLVWVAFPTSAGTVVGNGTGPATFTAAASASGAVQVLAYTLDGVAALGYCGVTVT